MVAKKKTAPPEQGDLADALANTQRHEDKQAGVASEFEQETAKEVERVETAAPPTEPAPKAKGWGKKAKPAAAPTGAADETVNLSNVKKSLLHGVERIERLMEERGAISEDIKEVFAELRGAGYNTKIIREVMKRRGWGDAAIKEHDSLVDLYEEALR
jgi:uncharacterized protein (UPF0335 family)